MNQVKIGDWLCKPLSIDNKCIYSQVIDIFSYEENGEKITVLKDAFFTKIELIERFDISFVTQEMLEKDFTKVSAEISAEIENYFKSTPKALEKFNRLTAKYFEYVNLLEQADISRATREHGNFYKQTTKKAAFVLNLHDKGDYFYIVYGFASTACMKGEEEHFSLYGKDDKYINLRFCTKIANEEDEAAAKAQIEKVFAIYRDVEKDDLLAIVKEKQKAFLNKITSVLKPLGFKKKATKWIYELSSGHALVFYAQKSAFSDQYYFNISVYPTKDNLFPECYGTRIRKNDTDIFDWQLMPEQEFEEIMQNALETEIMPIINATEEELCHMLKDKFCIKHFCTSCRFGKLAVNTGE
ncbi:MAG: DUF4304 domain-containing protein [Clostridia bacterium]|nr:DUF4304 domain-containing protein [Clostridia bacterium]